MSKSYHIFIPEWVPLSNKGEEAIVRGIGDVLFPDGNCQIHLLDQVDTYRYCDGIHVYPLAWFVSPWLYCEYRIGKTWESIQDSACSLTRNALNKVWGRWVKTWCRALRETASDLTGLSNGGLAYTEKQCVLQNLMQCDYIIAGHDGGLDERVCHILDLFGILGKEYGIFGVELTTKFKSSEIVDVHNKTLGNAKFLFCRTRKTVETVNKYFPAISASLCPDPAFGMKPTNTEQVERLIEREGLSEFFRKPVVMITCCEPAPIARFCFEDKKLPSEKIIAHRELLSDLVRHVVGRYDVNILFLPHATGPGDVLDDRVVARDVILRTQLSADKIKLIDSEINARDLKALIARSEFLIAERIHSIIGATGVNTPFLCLGSRTDRRIQGIIDDVLGMSDCIYYLNRPDGVELKDHFDACWNKRNVIGEHLFKTSAEFKLRLDNTGTVIRNFMNNKQ